MKYEVEISRDHGAWIADVVNLPGAHTYARNLLALYSNLDEVIRLVADLPDDEPVTTELHWLNVDADEREAIHLGERRVELEAEETRRQAAAALVAGKLVAKGITVRDAAAMLKISPGRISQITKHRAGTPIIENVAGRTKSKSGKVEAE